MNIPRIVRDYSKTVVTIISLDHNGQPLSVGTGFFINSKGFIATNHHVFEGSSTVVIKAIDGKNGEIIEIINDDPELDLSIAKTSFKNSPSVSYGDVGNISIGEAVVVIGNPVGLERTVSNGIVSGIREYNQIKIIQITAPISPGSSGGPVFNENGNVIGIATAYLDRGQNLNFAIPINYLKNLKPFSGTIKSLPKLEEKYNLSEKDNMLIKVSILGSQLPSFRKGKSIFDRF